MGQLKDLLERQSAGTFVGRAEELDSLLSVLSGDGPLVVCMHSPNLLYVWVAYTRPAQGWLYPVALIEAFGYGFGFAGYFVYLMYVAQRGNFRTSHYAIGTGLGALFITFAGILSGILQQAFGYKGFFIAACLFTLPGTLTLLFIPMDTDQARGIKAAGDH